jgi:hypothetical protein
MPDCVGDVSVFPLPAFCLGDGLKALEVGASHQLVSEAGRLEQRASDPFHPKRSCLPYWKSNSPVARGRCLVHAPAVPADEHKLTPTLQRFQALLEPVDDSSLSALAAESAAITRRHFGRAIRLFAPLYVSNECINNCAYCGFSRDNAILRVTLDVAAVVREARHLVAEGFRNILLVAGEHPKFVSSGYLEACVSALASEVPSIALEVGPMEAGEYRQARRRGSGRPRGLPGDLRS